MHPPSTGSHVKSIFAVTKELVARGHTVTTVRYDTAQGITLPYIGPNHTEYVISFNNSDGAIPYVTKSERGVFLINEMLHWQYALNMFENSWRGMHTNPFTYVMAACENFLGNRQLVNLLRSTHFDVAVVDLIQNECQLALVVDMGLPVVGFWLSLPVGLEMEATTQPTPPSHIPYLMSGLSDKMSFWQRCKNACLKVFHFFVLHIHTRVCDYMIWKHIPHSPPSIEMLSNISGCLINSHSIFEVAMPRVPTFVNILGSMIDKKPGPLPKVNLLYIFLSNSDIHIPAGCVLRYRKNAGYKLK